MVAWQYFGVRSNRVGPYTVIACFPTGTDVFGTTSSSHPVGDLAGIGRGGPGKVGPAPRLIPRQEHMESRFKDPECRAALLNAGIAAVSDALVVFPIVKGFQLFGRAVEVAASAARGSLTGASRLVVRSSASFADAAGAYGGGLAISNFLAIGQNGNMSGRDVWNLIPGINAGLAIGDAIRACR